VRPRVRPVHVVTGVWRHQDQLQRQRNRTVTRRCVGVASGSLQHLGTVSNGTADELWLLAEQRR
jgi:hypothetical protein